MGISGYLHNSEKIKENKEYDQEVYFKKLNKNLGSFGGIIFKSHNREKESTKSFSTKCL